MEFNFVDIAPYDDKGYMTIRDYVLRIVAYLSKAMDYNNYFNGQEMIIICTHIFDEFFINKNGYNFDYRFWLFDQYELLNVASNSLYIDYINDEHYGGKIFPDTIRDDDKLFLDKIDNYLKKNNMYKLRPHTYDHNEEFHKHSIKFYVNDEMKEYLKSVTSKNSPSE